MHPESRHWFIHTDRAETRYVAELGYYRPGRQWVTIATSAPAVTPPDTASTDQTVRFATIPAQVRLTQLAALAKQAVPADLPPPDAARERTLAEMVSLRLARQDQGSSAEITELVRGRGEQEVSARNWRSPRRSAAKRKSVSSPLGAAGAAHRKYSGLTSMPKLVIYGATEPDAQRDRWRTADLIAFRRHLQLPLLLAGRRAHGHRVRHVSGRGIAAGRAELQPPHGAPGRSRRRAAKTHPSIPPPPKLHEPARQPARPGLWTFDFRL